MLTKGAFDLQILYKSDSKLINVHDTETRAKQQLFQRARASRKSSNTTSSQYCEYDVIRKRESRVDDLGPPSHHKADSPFCLHTLGEHSDEAAVAHDPIRVT